FAFITMYDVVNVGLWGNRFSNEHFPFEVAGMGIYTEFATLRLLNSGQYGKNKFENLEVGIRTMDINSTYVTKVKGTEFIDNHGGIHLIGARNAIVSEDYFEIKGASETDVYPWCGTGYA